MTQNSKHLLSIVYHFHDFIIVSVHYFFNLDSVLLVWCK